MWESGRAYHCGSHSLLTAGDSAGASSVRVLTAGLSALPGGCSHFPGAVVGPECLKAGEVASLQGKH